MKQKYYIILLLIFSVFAGYAHDSNVATASISLDENTDEWRFTISFSTYGLFKGLEDEYGKGEVGFDQLEEFNRKLDKYIKKSFFLSINMHYNIQLEEFNSEIGDHQSNIYYVLKGVPKIPRHWELSFDVCKYNNAQINVVKIKFYDNARSFHLKKEKRFQTNFILTKKSINEITKSNQ